MTNKVLITTLDNDSSEKKIGLSDSEFYFYEFSINPSRKDFAALGGLPFEKKVKITYKGKSVIAKKKGVADGTDRHPKIGISQSVAKRLGIPIGTYVYVIIQII